MAGPRTYKVKSADHKPQQIGDPKRKVAAGTSGQQTGATRSGRTGQKRQNKSYTQHEIKKPARDLPILSGYRSAKADEKTLSNHPGRSRVDMYGGKTTGARTGKTIVPEREIRVDTKRKGGRPAEITG